ncbi:MAG: 2-amino-4-hydroxy-6-hydroxymethyldihydropteridine diphosphokinase [Noviherbaspirillum sp.]
MSAVSAYIGLGANLGDARATVEAALKELGELPGTRLRERSSLFRTAPVDAGGDDYINAVARVETTLGAADLLARLRDIEQAHGRERAGYNAPRTLDLDLLLYGREKIATAELTVPHPRMTQRAFVLIPLLQIAPLINIPGMGPAHNFVPDVAGQAIAVLRDQN